MFDILSIRDAAAAQLTNAGDESWAARLRELPPERIHIAVCVEPFLTRIFTGEKTLESRLARNRITPWHRVRAGDAVLLKHSGGPIVGGFEVSACDYIEIGDIEAFWTKYGDALCVDDDFRQRKRASRYATLLTVGRPFALPEPIPCREKNRRSWIDFPKEHP